jgi:quercetin dioxygenase-like cupin family protein
MQFVEGDKLGAILVTRVRAGQSVKPHSDPGWHARHYQKFAIQVQSAPGQAFCFEGEQLVSKPGDVYWFDNQHTHWVVNDSDHDRITAIVCIKTDKEI